MGRIASGKSRLAKRFFEETNLAVFSCDERRKKLAGIPLLERTPELRKKEIYSEEFSEKTYNAVIDSAIEHMKSGKSSIIDCTFSKRKHRDLVLRKLRENKIPFIFIEAAVSEDIMKERLIKRAHKKDVISDARVGDFEKINAGYEIPYELNKSHYIQIDTSSDKDTVFYDCGKKLIDLIGDLNQYSFKNDTPVQN
jgi:hypothetical protein